MKKLDYPENKGKIWFRNLEIQHLTNGIDEAFKGILSGLSDANSKAEGIKLSGCEVTVVGNDYSVTAGFVYLLGEVFVVEAQNITSPDTVYFDIESQDYNAERPAPILDGVTHQTRKNRIVKLVSSDSPPNDRMGIYAPTYQKRIMDAAHPVGHPVWFDPRLDGEVMEDYFNMITGVGLEDKRYNNWIVLVIFAGTEDYKSRCLVVLDNSDVDLDVVGKIYGAKEHLLLENEMPSHDHAYVKAETEGSKFTGSASGFNRSVPAAATTDPKGGDSPHNNMQPSIVAALICRKSDNGYYIP